MEKGDVILVTENGEAIGTMEKMEAHRRGVLHRAFSIFIFDQEGNMLLQRRAAKKYHGGGLWTNACCSHPYPEESLEAAAYRRLQEELGFQTKLGEVFAFTYMAAVENGLIEHEYDHVFCGEYRGALQPNAEEVEATAYIPMEDLERQLQEAPSRFTSWFRIVFPQIREWWREAYGNRN